MLEKHIWLLDLTDSDGNSALHYAAQKNNSQVVELLLNKQAQLAYKPNRERERQSPLHVAAHYGSTAAIKALPRRGRDGGQPRPQRLPRLRRQRQDERAQVPAPPCTPRGAACSTVSTTTATRLSTSPPR